MNLLKHIEVYGEIAMERAYLTVEYTFVNDTDASCRPHYIFPIPREGEISGLQLLSREKQLLRAKLYPLRDEGLGLGVRLTEISPSLYCLETEGMDAGEECRILLELFCPLTPCQEGAQLVFPLGTGGAGQSEPCTVAMALYVDSKLVSASHSVKIEQDRICVNTVSGKDVVITLARKKESHGLIQEQWGECIGVYRLCTQTPARYRRQKKNKVLLLLDTAWTGEERLFSALKELCYRAVQALPSGTLVQVMAGSLEFPLLGKDMMEGEELCQNLLLALSEVPHGGTVQSLLERAKHQTDADTLTVLFSGGRMPLPAGTASSQVHLVTAGTAVTTLLAHSGNWEEHLHCYPEEIPAERMAEAMKRWTQPTAEVTVIPQNPVMDMVILPNGDIGVDGYLDLVIRTTGQAPSVFAILQDGEVKETLAVEKITRMEHLPMAEQSYGRAKRMQLESLLRRTDVGSHRAIKEQIEAVSLRYGVLSKETVFALRHTADSSAQAVEFCLSADGGFATQTVFGESERNIGNKRELASACLKVLIENIRTDGGLYQGITKHAEQTAWAVLALSGAKEKDRAIAAVIKDAQDYLSVCHITGTAGFLYHNQKDYCKEVWMNHLPKLDELLGQELTVTVAAQLLLHLS